MSLIEAVNPFKSNWEAFAREVSKPLTCAFCGGQRVWWNGERLRAASVCNGAGIVHLVRIRCRRVKCGNQDCRRSWTLRPPGLAPHRHYQLCVVASALSTYLFDPKANQAAVAQAHQCSERTVGRWLRWVSQAADPAILQRKVLEALGEPVLVPVRTVANLARKARHAARLEILPRAAHVLAAFEALGAAMGLEPPGLRGVLERVLGNRSRFPTYRSPIIPEFAR